VKRTTTEDTVTNGVSRQAASSETAHFFSHDELRDGVLVSVD
jgi:hypothetical protein